MKESENKKRSERLRDAIVRSFKPAIIHELGHYIISKKIAPAHYYYIRAKFSASEENLASSYVAETQHIGVDLLAAGQTHLDEYLSEDQKKLIAVSGIVAERIAGYNHPHLTEYELMSETDIGIFNNSEEFEQYAKQAEEIIEPHLDSIMNASRDLAINLSDLENGEYFLKEEHFQEYFNLDNKTDRSS